MDLKKEPVIKNEGEDFFEKDQEVEHSTVKCEQPVINVDIEDTAEERKETEDVEVKTVEELEDENSGVDVCRLCACDIVDKSYCIYEPSEVSFYEKINFSLPITVNLDDDMPSYMCELCKNTLEDVYNFANKVAQANEALKIRFNKSSLIFKEVPQPSETITENPPKEGETKSNLKAHYVCHLCGKKYKYEHQLLAHSEDHKDLKSSIVPVCSSCGETFVSEESATAHLAPKFDVLQKCTRIEHNLVDMAYICEFCEKFFVNSNKLMYHKKAEHKYKMYSCSVCGVKFTTYARRQDHKEVHVEEEKDKPDELPLMKHYLCDICGKSYLQYDYLSAHYKLKHRTPSKTYKCQKCKEVYPNGTAISYHYKIKHNVNYFLCPEKACYNQFTTESALKKHLNDVHKAPVVCYKCGKIFADKPSLRHHIQNNHATLINICEVCGLTFKTLKAFESHKVEHLTGETEKKYTCVICKKAYAYRFELQKHMRGAHSGNFRLLVDMDEDSMDQDVAKSLIALRTFPETKGMKRSHQEMLLNFANRYGMDPNNPMDINMVGKDPSYYSQVLHPKSKARISAYQAANNVPAKIYLKEVQQQAAEQEQVQYCYVNVEGNRKILMLDNSS